MVGDLNKDITNIQYNHLNLPKSIYIGQPGFGGSIHYNYDATGVKLSKNVIQISGGSTSTHYAGNYIYELINPALPNPLDPPPTYNLKFFSHPEGYIEPDGSGGFKYTYQYKDHLGNVRLSYSDTDNDGVITAATEIKEENNYYPFGLKHKGYNNVVNGRDHKFEFQGQEITEDLGYNMHEFRWRHYDASIGRFVSIDPLARDFSQWSPYVFSGNLVIVSKELEGLEPSFLISQGGKVTSPMATLLHSAYGYSLSSLSNTTWMPYTDPRAGFWGDIVGIPDETSASVRGTSVIHDDDQLRSDEKWFTLITHEQSHRFDVEKDGNKHFYIKYLKEGATGKYRDISTEKKAFEMGDSSEELLKYDNGAALKVLRNNDISDQDKSSQLESIGAKFKRDVILKDNIVSGEKNLQNLNKELSSCDDCSDSLKAGLKSLIKITKIGIEYNKIQQQNITDEYGD